MIFTYTNELYHHGIKGQKWGVRRFQRKDGTRTAAGKKRQRELQSNNSDKKKINKGLTDGQKKAIKIGAIAVGTALAAYGAYRLYKSGELDELIQNGKNLLKDKNIDVTTEINPERPKPQRPKPKEVLDKCTKIFGKDTVSFKPLVDESAMESYYNNMAKDLSLNADQQTALKSYVGNGFRDINLLLREGHVGLYTDDINAVSKSVDNITEAIKGSKIKDNIITHRGTGKNLNELFGLPSDTPITKENIEQFKGFRFKDKAFGSSSLDLVSANNFSKSKGVVEHIFMPKGSKALSVAGISPWSSEYEVLIQRDTTFSLKDALFDSDGNITDIFIEIVDQIK